MATVLPTCMKVGTDRKECPLCLWEEGQLVKSLCGSCIKRSAGKCADHPHRVGCVTQLTLIKVADKTGLDRLLERVQ